MRVVPNTIEIVKDRRGENDFRVISCLIISDTLPETMPTTGEDVLGLEETDRFAPGCLLYVANTSVENRVFIANEQGQFVAM